MADESSIQGAFRRVGILIDQTWWNSEDFNDEYKLASLQLWNGIVSPYRKHVAGSENNSNGMGPYKIVRADQNSVPGKTVIGSCADRSGYHSNPMEFQKTGKLIEEILPYTVENMEQLALHEKISNSSIRRIWLPES
ncbi:Hypothetical protein NTJ_12212 [Nesidiocoris tenuis]|uniref:Uncharacterized protein n=1 Tax=Nesidiocoris tenuis TaxID=355587 RepID=A0ABN7B6B6_9HEMI|nr:Hypothetical protein NTJ_12212 [Nesidiocoris tenuis]